MNGSHKSHALAIDPTSHHVSRGLGRLLPGTIDRSPLLTRTANSSCYSRYVWSVRWLLPPGSQPWRKFAIARSAQRGKKEFRRDAPVDLVVEDQSIRQARLLRFSCQRRIPQLEIVARIPDPASQRDVVSLANRLAAAIRMDAKEEDDKSLSFSKSSIKLSTRSRILGGRM